MNFIKYLILFTYFSYAFGQVKAQNKIKLNESDLKKSFQKLKEEDFFNIPKREYHFTSVAGFERIYSVLTVIDIINTLNKIELPFDVDSLRHIRVIKCFYGTEAYAIWYISITDKNGYHYFFTYDDNLGIKKIPLLGTIQGKDFFWEIGNLLFHNRDEKNEGDYMILAEIENGMFTSLDGTQNYYIGDDSFFKMITILISMQNCK